MATGQSVVNLSNRNNKARDMSYGFLFLRSSRGQSIIEYSLVFIAFALGVILVFGLNAKRAKNAFESGADSAIEHIKR
jgi:hypothetical protein